MDLDKKHPWDMKFAPSFTPIEMLDKGVFMDCHYNAVIKGLPSSWYSHKNVIPKNKTPNAELNHYGVKSRQSLKVWNESGWTTKDSPLGWWEWYIKYYFGRRLEEDQMQIGRWRSFVARHMGQIRASCHLTDEKCRPIQRQALLQWGWNSEILFTPETEVKNLKNLGVYHGEHGVPKFFKW
jgi:hypothetical protein